MPARRRPIAARTPSLSPKMDVPATRTFAPAATASGAVSASNAAHARGIIQGDLKPAYIFIQRAAAPRSDRPEYLQHPLFGWRGPSAREFPKDLGAGRRPATRHRAIRGEPENSMRHGVCGP